MKILIRTRLRSVELEFKSGRKWGALLIESPHGEILCEDLSRVYVRPSYGEITLHVISNKENLGTILGTLRISSTELVLDVKHTDFLSAFQIWREEEIPVRVTLMGKPLEIAALTAAISSIAKKVLGIR